jgi:hypothetical protein
VSLTTPFGRRGLRVAEQGFFSTTRTCAGSFCRSLYALALMFPPTLSSHTQGTHPGSQKRSKSTCSPRLAAMTTPSTQSSPATAATSSSSPTAAAALCTLVVL